MAKKQPDVLEERIMTVPLRSEWIETRRVMRSKKAVNAVKNFVKRHMKAKDVKISGKLNEAIWKSGAKKPPARIRVKATIDSAGLALVRLPEEITLEEEKKKFLGKSKEEKMEAREKITDEKQEKAPEAPKEEAKPEAKGKK